MINNIALKDCPWEINITLVQPLFHLIFFMLRSKMIFFESKFGCDGKHFWNLAIGLDIVLDIHLDEN